jgi:poly(3-hydroxybutyrate) depolymerase
MTLPQPATHDKLSSLSVPFLWPMAAAAQLVERGLDLYATNLDFIAEEQKIHHELRPQFASPNRVMLDLRTMLLRDYSAPPPKASRPSSTRPMPGIPP